MAKRILQFITHNQHIRGSYVPCVGVACISTCLSLKRGWHTCLNESVHVHKKESQLFAPVAVFTLYGFSLNELSDADAKPA